jgi:hypothetical protein
MVIARLHGKAEKSEIEEIKWMAETDVGIPDISGGPVFLQSVALPGVLVRCSRAHQRICLEKSACRVLISLQKLEC